MNLQFNAAVIINNEIFFSAKNFNGLFKMSFDNQKVIFLGYFPGDGVWAEYLHQFAIKDKNFIYFVPYSAHGMSKYNFLTGEISLINIYEENNTAIAHVLKYENNFIFVPRYLNNPIAFFKPSSEELLYLVLEDIDKKYLCNSICDIYGAEIVKNRLIIPIYDKDYIVEIDLTDKKTSIVNLPGTRNSTVTFFNDKYWTVSSNGKEVCCYTKNFNFLKKYSFLNNSSRPYQAWINVGNDLYLCGCLSDSLLKYNVISDKWENVLYEGIAKVKDNWAYMCGFQKCENELYIFPSATNALLVMNHNKIWMIEINFNDENQFKYIKKEKYCYYFEKHRSEIYEEGQTLSLENMIEYLSNKE